MNEPKPFASLSPSLLARKGGARPAMRPQIQPLQQFHDNAARQIEDDLGWNDMGYDQGGHDAPHPVHAPAPIAAPLPKAPPAKAPAAEVVALKPTASLAPAKPEVPEVVRQQARIAKRVAQTEASARRSALSDGRRAAFTLRLDAERHLKLRLACTIANRSAQQIVTDALDQFIATLPEVTALAAQVRKRG